MVYVYGLNTHWGCGGKAPYDNVKSNIKCVVWKKCMV